MALLIDYEFAIFLAERAFLRRGQDIEHKPEPFQYFHRKRRQAKIGRDTHFKGEATDMTFELTMLAAASAWGFIQLVAAAQAANVQYGFKWAASPRDAEVPPLNLIAGRINRNFRNYLETFAFFAVAVLTAQAVGIHDALTHWGAIAYLGGRVIYTALYICGVPLVRSLFWNVATFGVFAILVAPFVT